MYRVAIIGCGGIARAHAGGYADVPNCRIVAAADINAEALTGFCEQFAIPGRYADYETMLAEERPDLVSVCTWPPLHPAPVIAAAKAGARGILCEKPIALTLPEADAMLSAATATGAVLIIGHQRRFEPRYALARERIAAGDIGALEEVQANCAGDLVSDGTHAIDLIRFLAGDLAVESVFAQIDLRPPNVPNTTRVGYGQWQATGRRYGHEIEGGCLAQVRFAGGVRGLLRTGLAAPPVGYQRLRVFGDSGRIDISGDPRSGHPAFLRIWRQGDSDWQDMPLPAVNAFAAEIRALAGKHRPGHSPPARRSVSAWHPGNPARRHGIGIPP
ncbi:MAG: Gfo/Idh/MocA family protein [Chloroflexota bacterium]